MRFGSVNYETKGKVAILTLDEPSKLNALTAGIRDGILAGLKQADVDESIRVAIITGNGDKAFCAGADITGFELDPEKGRDFLAAALNVLAAPEHCSKPVISRSTALPMAAALNWRSHPTSSLHPSARASRCRRFNSACCPASPSFGCRTLSAARRPKR